MPVDINYIMGKLINHYSTDQKAMHHFWITPHSLLHDRTPEKVLEEDYKLLMSHIDTILSREKVTRFYAKERREGKRLGKGYRFLKRRRMDMLLVDVKSVEYRIDKPDIPRGMFFIKEEVV